MNAELWTALLVGLLGGAAGTFIKGLFDRPTTSAGARQTNVTAEVSLSADSREWVSQAMGRAERAEKRADDAVDRVNQVEEENDELRLKFNLLLDYVRLLHRDWPPGSHKPPPPPAMLRLDPHVRRDGDASTDPHDA